MNFRLEEKDKKTARRVHDPLKRYTSLKYDQNRAKINQKSKKQKNRNIVFERQNVGIKDVRGFLKQPARMCLEDSFSEKSLNDSHIQITQKTITRRNSARNQYSQNRCRGWITDRPKGSIPANRNPKMTRFYNIQKFRKSGKLRKNDKPKKRNPCCRVI